MRQKISQKYQEINTQMDNFRIMDGSSILNYTIFNLTNGTDIEHRTLPPQMTFTNRSLTVIIVYCICFIIAAIGNLTVFVTLSRGRYRKSRIALMICHLSAADLLVTFFMIPLEVGWRLTVQWLAGNLACKVFLFLRAFGLYLSSNILICVSLDRYFAVLHPLKLNDARRRGKLMLSVAWIFSVVYAIPQSFIFHVSAHPKHPNFTQCVTFGFFKSSVDENVYNIFCVLAMYFIPLVVICWVYTKILCEITSKTRESKQVFTYFAESSVKFIVGSVTDFFPYGFRPAPEDFPTRVDQKFNQTSVKRNSLYNLISAFTRTCSNGTLGSLNSGSENRMRLRCSDMSRIERARIRTLRMTITIVAVFILCWTPYVTMMLWYIFDRQSAQQVDQEIQEALFIMAVGNSCANPLVYGSYAVDLKKECCRCFLPSSRKTKTNTIYVQRSTGPKSLILEKKSPGVSMFIIESVRRILHDYFKVGGSGQMNSTIVCNATLVSSSNPRTECVVIKEVTKKLYLQNMKSHKQERDVKSTEHL